MCWRTPEIRTPNCGAIGCYPPDKSKELSELQSKYDELKTKSEKLVEALEEYADLHHAPKLEEALTEWRK